MSFVEVAAVVHVNIFSRSFHLLVFEYSSSTILYSAALGAKKPNYLLGYLTIRPVGSPKDTTCVGCGPFLVSLMP
ncbi:MAG TPA: hypothetical protein VGI33_13360 [Paenibacillus sp.]